MKKLIYLDATKMAKDRNYYVEIALQVWVNKTDVTYIIQCNKEVSQKIPAAVFGKNISSKHQFNQLSYIVE